MVLCKLSVSSRTVSYKIVRIDALETTTYSSRDDKLARL
jgi:hypothetical protein